MWAEVEASEPAFAARVRTAFDAYKHKTLATLRRDGSPRLSGIEATFVAGILWIGMMPDSVKAYDLRRDPRLALHSATADADLILGDAKLSGRASEVTDAATKRAWLPAEMPPEDAAVFVIDIADVALTRIGDPPDHLVIESWTAARGLTRIERR